MISNVHGNPNGTIAIWSACNVIMETDSVIINAGPVHDACVRLAPNSRRMVLDKSALFAGSNTGRSQGDYPATAVDQPWLDRSTAPNKTELNKPNITTKNFFRN